MPYNIKPLSPNFGAEISGIDLTEDISDSLVKELIAVWIEVGGLLVIHEQDLTTKQHIEFSRNFGPLFGDSKNEPLQDTVSRYIHPEYPQVYRVSNQTDYDGIPLGRKGAGTYWHSDVSFRECPAQASILHGKQSPDVGGDTVFADQAQAYSSLSEGMKSMLATLKAWHDFEVAARTQYVKPIVVENDMSGQNRALHPLVRTHKETKRKSLYVNPGFTSHIDNFSYEESSVILKFLYDHCTRPEFTYRHTWREKELVIWDTRTTMHYAVMDYSDDQLRYMERCTVIGERPQ